ncbi:MAG: replication initiator protein A [Candidatus Paceibacterota bacterium]
MGTGKIIRVGTQNQEHDFESGVDELNLAEFPLAAVSDRFLEGEKTVVFEDTVFCQEQKRHVPRRLTISGSDRYGLPTAMDDDVLLACIQISRLGNFASPEVCFSRYEILKLLRLPDKTRNYDRVASSLRRWKGLTIYSDRAFYDHEHKSWVNRDFGIFDNLYIYRKEASQGQNAASCSRIVWNEVMYRSFQAGYLKRLDWGLYTRLESPVAKRLYRFLDKRFYYGNRVEIDLRELAVQKVRLSDKYNVAQMKRTLLKGIVELEEAWDLKRMDNESRFLKEGKGCWKVVFERKPQKRVTPSRGEDVLGVSTRESTAALSAPESGSLLTALTKRGIGPGAADDLIGSRPQADIQTMLELFDWYNSHGQPRGPGFLVGAIKNPSGIAFPKGFESSATIETKKAAEKNRIASERELRTKRERDAARKENVRQEAFLAFWRSLSPGEQSDFERDALDSAEPTKRTGYLRAMGKRTGPTFEHYRMVILRDHFERTVQSQQIRPS